MINIKNLVVGLCMLVSGFVVYVIKEKLHSKTDKPLLSVLICENVDKLLYRC